MSIWSTIGQAMACFKSQFLYFWLVWSVGNVSMWLLSSCMSVCVLSSSKYLAVSCTKSLNKIHSSLEATNDVGSIVFFSFAASEVLLKLTDLSLQASENNAEIVFDNEISSQIAECFVNIVTHQLEAIPNWKYWIGFNRGPHFKKSRLYYCRIRWFSKIACRENIGADWSNRSEVLPRNKVKKWNGQHRRFCECELLTQINALFTTTTSLSMKIQCQHVPHCHATTFWTTS